MTHNAGFAAAGVVEAIFAITPAFTMRVETDGATFGTVAVKTNIAAGVAGLTGRQAATCFAGMTDRPVMEVGGDG